METARSKSRPPFKVVENKSWGDLQIQTEKLVNANQVGIVIIDKQQETVFTIVMAIQNDKNNKNMRYWRNTKGSRKKVKATVVPVAIE